MSKQITDNATKATPSASDYVLIRDVAAATDKKATVGSLSSALSTLPNNLDSSAPSSWAWQSYTPTWSNFTVGDATVTARFTQVGKMIVVRIMLVLGSASPISGNLAFSLPVTAAAAYGSNLYRIGDAFYEDVAVNGYHGAIYATTAAGVNSTTTARFVVLNAGSTYLVDNNVTATVPFTFGSGDKISCLIVYEGA